MIIYVITTHIYDNYIINIENDFDKIMSNKLIFFIYGCQLMIINDVILIIIMILCVCVYIIFIICT